MMSETAIAKQKLVTGMYRYWTLVSCKVLVKSEIARLQVYWQAVYVLEAEIAEYFNFL